MLGLVGYLIYSKSSKVELQGEVKIAVNIPLTGPVAAFSGQYVNGLNMGIDQACKELGIDRRLFAIDAQDNQGEPQIAATIAQKQVASGFDVYISGVSQMTRAVAPIVDDACDIHFMVSYDAHLAEQHQKRVRILPHFKAEGPAYAQYAISRKAKRVLAFTLNNPEIQGQFSEFVQPVLEKAGIEFTREIYEFGHNDFRSLALKAKFAKPDVILVSGFSLHVAPILDALRSESLISDGNVLCIMDFNELLTDKESYQRYQDVAYIAPPFSFPDNAERRQAWSTDFEKKFGIAPNFLPAFAYDTGRMIVISHSKSMVVSPETITKLTPFPGVAGEITVDASGDLSTPLGILKVKANGTLERIPLNNAESAIFKKAG
jgi:ABC-type branched-subunit amino acid transport system substrate-binding protein